MNCVVDVVRNNDVELEKLHDYSAVILSPGPGLPKDHQNLMDIICECDGQLPVLGVCLGMQAIALHLGGELENKQKVMHGVEERINVVSHASLFKGLSRTLKVGLYHSWKVKESVNYKSDAFAVSDNTLMAISNESKLLFGIQFHPESIMTEHGREVLQNFLDIKKGNH
jgi:anthranilate synthase component 2